MTSANNKLIHKQFKTMIPSMSWKDLERLFKQYSQIVGQNGELVCKEISYKCFESDVSISSKKSSGYGRCEQEASSNAIKNILDILIQSQPHLNILKLCFKKINQPINQSSKQNQPRKSLSIKPHISTISSYQTKQNKQNKRSRSHLKSTHDSLNYSILKTNTRTPAQLQLQAAKTKISHLQLKIRILQQQNKYLKQRKPTQQNQTTPIHIPIPTSSNSNTSSNIEQIRLSLGPRLPKSHFQKLNCSVQDVIKPSDLQVKKTKVPKLKLQILPNFHGKSTKSINQSFIANKEC